jgi:hypothetical protein
MVVAWLWPFNGDGASAKSGGRRCVPQLRGVEERVRVGSIWSEKYLGAALT